MRTAAGICHALAILLALPLLASAQQNQVSEGGNAPRPARVRGVELDTRGTSESALILSTRELEYEIEVGGPETLILRLPGAVLADQVDKRVRPDVEGSIREIRIDEQIDGNKIQVRVEIDHAPGLQAQVSKRGAIISVAFPVALRAADARFALHLENEELVSVVETLAKQSGERFLYDKTKLAGRVTISAPGRVNNEEALALLDALLYLRGLAAVPMHSGFRKIIETAQIPSNAPFAPGGPSERGEAPIATLIRLERADVDKVVQALTPALGRTGLALPLYESRSILLAGYEDQLHRFLVMAQALDRQSPDELRILHVASRPAGEVVPLLRELAEEEARAASEPFEIWADERTNALIVRAAPARFETLRDYLRVLDQDAEGRGSVQVIPIRNADPQSIAEHLVSLGDGEGAGGRNGDALKGASLRVALHPSTRSLVVQADPETQALVRALVRELDQRPPQVSVEATVLEVTLGEDFDLGLDYALTLGGENPSPDDVIGTLSKLPPGGLLDLDQDLGAADPVDFAGRINHKEVAIPIVGPNGPTTLLLPLAQVLVTANNGEVVSRSLMRPHFVATSGEEQEFFVGDEVPIPVASGSGNGSGETGAGGESAAVGSPLDLRTDIERESVGLTLRVKPTLSRVGSIRLDLELDVTAVDATTLGREIGVTLQQRRLQATAHLRPYEFALIGFTSRNRQVDGTSGMPWFKDLPVVGWLFRDTVKRDFRSYFVVAVQAVLQRGPEEQLAESIRARLAFERSLARASDLRGARGVRYAILMATRTEQTQADTVARQLPLAQGEDTRVAAWEWDGKTRFDVMVTGYPTLAHAGRAVERLSKTGFRPRVIAIPADPDAKAP